VNAVENLTDKALLVDIAKNGEDDRMCETAKLRLQELKKK